MKCSQIKSGSISGKIDYEHSKPVMSVSTSNPKQMLVYNGLLQPGGQTTSELRGVSCRNKVKETAVLMSTTIS